MHHKLVASLAWTIATCLLLASNVHGAPYELVQTYYGSDQSRLFGWSMSPFGKNNLAIGSLQDRTAGSEAGAVYVLDAATGQIQLTVPNPTPVEIDFFGQSLVPVGNNLLIGANWDGHVFGAGAKYPGAAYLVDGKNGALLHTFQSPSEGGFSFGSAVALAGNNLLIAEESAQNGREAVYLFDAGNQNLVRTIANIGYRSGLAGANSYVAVDGTNMLIGRPGDNNEVGGASLYDTTTGALLQTFSAPFITNGDNFGYEVAVLPGNRFAISAPYADRGATDSGAVYIIDGATGTLLHTLLDPNASPYGNFGVSIAAVADTILIGAPFDDVGAENDGAAYLFSTTTGELLHTFINPTPQDHDWFGRSVGAIGNDYLIAAVEDNTMAPQAGAVYRFAAVPEPSTIVLAVMGTVGLLARAIRRRFVA